MEAAPYNADILAAAAWLYYFEGNSDPDSYAWAKRAIELNPAHPDWYNVPLGLAAFFAEEFQTSVDVLRNAPQTLETIMVLGAAEALAGDVERARSLSRKFRSNGAIRTISDYFGGIDIRNDPRFSPLVRGAELAGFPI